MATEECPICLTSLAEASTTSVTCCRKVMHTKCYIQCMNVKPECPMCRAPQEHVVIQVVTIPPVYMSQRSFVKFTFGTILIGLAMTVVVWAAETQKI